MGSTSTSSPPLALEQLAVEVAAGAPLGAADQSEGAGHGGNATRPRLLAPGCYPSVASPPMSISTLGIVGSGIMGSGIAEVAAKAGIDVILRSRQQATADAMVASLEKSLAKQVERGKLEETRRQGDRGAGHRHRRPPRPARLRPRARVGGGGPRREEGAVHPARRHREARGASSPPTPPPCRWSSWPMATERPDAGGGHPLLQPGADDEPRRGHRAADRRRRDRRRRQGVRHRLRQGRRRGQGPRRLHRRTRCSSRTSTTPCGCSRPAPPAATTSTPP